jgi:hypothetical protein
LLSPETIIDPDTREQLCLPRPVSDATAAPTRDRCTNEEAGGSSWSINTLYWTFHEEDETLKLCFLSTVGGNQQPLFLSATAEEDGALALRALQPDFLEVHVKPQAETLAKATMVQLTPYRKG